MAKIRATYHSGRTRRDGSAYNPDHNDRKQKGMKEAAEHIDFKKTDGNFEWKIMRNCDSFSEAEAAYYSKHFGAALNVQNDRYEKARKRSLIATMDDWRTSPRRCPEESIVQVGDREAGVSAEQLKKCIIEQVKWERETFTQVVPLDIAIHADEPGAGVHAHIRRVFIGHDKEGNEIPAQDKCLQEMGIEAPNPNKARTRYNNRKITYTTMLREHWYKVLKEHGFTIETKPRERGKSGRTLEELKATKAEERVAEAEKRLSELNHEIEQAEKHNRRTLSKYRADRSELDDDRAAFEAECDKYYQDYTKRLERLEAREAAASEQFDRIAELQDLAKQRDSTLHQREEAVSRKAERLKAVENHRDMATTTLAAKMSDRVLLKGWEGGIDSFINNHTRDANIPEIPKTPDIIKMIDDMLRESRNRGGRTR